MEAAAEAIGSFTTGTTIVMLVLSTILTGALAQLWGLINVLQLIAHLPLIASATFPPACLAALSELIQVCSFDFLDTENWIFKGILGFNIPDSREKYMLDSVDLVGYGSEFMVINAGTLYIVLVFSIL